MADPGEDLLSSPAAAQTVLNELGKITKPITLPADLAADAPFTGIRREVSPYAGRGRGHVRFKAAGKLRIIKPNTEGMV
jgi:hypothetical protein